MNKAVIFDTETTNLPEWKKPSGDPCQPHLVQLAALQVDMDKREILSSMDVIIRPEGWVSGPEALETHGITTEMAMDLGVPESLAVEMLLEMQKGSTRVAFNRTFDQRMIRIACKRYFTDEVTDEWASKDNFDCAMLLSKPIMKLTPKNKWGYKQPKLVDAYKFFTGRELENAHSAMADTMACFEVYCGIKDGITEAVTPIGLGGSE